MGKVDKNGHRTIDCKTCVLYRDDNWKCYEYEYFDTRKAVEIVQIWSDMHHPAKTYLEDLLKKYPNAELGKDGTPVMCPSHLGLKNIKDKNECECNCIVCWNQAIEK